MRMINIFRDLLGLCFLLSPLMSLAGIQMHETGHHYRLLEVSETGKEYIYEKSTDYSYDSDRQYFAVMGEKSHSLSQIVSKKAITHAGFIPSATNSGSYVYIFNSDTNELIVSQLDGAQGGLTSSSFPIPAQFGRVDRIFATIDGLFIRSGNTRQRHVYFLNLSNKELSKHALVDRGDRLSDLVEYENSYYALVLGRDETTVRLRIIDKKKNVMSEASYDHKKVVNQVRFIRGSESPLSALVRESVKGMFSFNLGYRFSKLTFDKNGKDTKAQEIFSLDSIRNGDPSDAILQCSGEKNLYWVEQYKGSVLLRSLASENKISAWEEDSLPEKTFLREADDGKLLLLVNFSKDIQGYYNYGFISYLVDQNCS